MTWHIYDTWIVLTGALAAMSCALPGVWLVLRRQSLLGDALSHTALPGIVVAFLLSQLLQRWFPPEWHTRVEQGLLASLAVLVGVGTAILAEVLQKLGRVESSAALGVVFTSLFALGLFLVRLVADQTDLDADCVLFGQLELAVLETVSWGAWELPQAALTNGLWLMINGLLIWACFKELRIAAFDPEMAVTVGVPARGMHYLLMAMTALTLVAAFRTVGSILVIGLLVIPAASATLITRRLNRLIGLSLLFAAAAAPLGHLLAKTLPQPIFSRLGFTEVHDVSTSGMMAFAAGLLFCLAIICAPERGALARLWRRWQLAVQIASDDVLGTLFRRDESDGTRPVEEPGLSWGWRWLAELQLRRLGYVTSDAQGLILTPSGREAARKVVQAHRLWEAYLQKHFDLPADHLHAPAHWVEHFLDDELRERLLAELDDPTNDPHGREIPK